MKRLLKPRCFRDFFSCRYAIQIGGRTAAADSHLTLVMGFGR
jgi:hypothetical protein